MMLAHSDSSPEALREIFRASFALGFRPHAAVIYSKHLPESPVRLHGDTGRQITAVDPSLALELRLKL
jgi:hypothetical protein